MKLLIATISVMLMNFSAISQVTANFTFDTLICVGDCLTFTNTSTGTINEYTWNFQGGDPISSQAENPGTVCYENAGTFLVELTVAGPSGTDVISKILYVIDYPDSVFAYYDTTIEMGGTAYIFADGYNATTANVGFYNWVTTGAFDCYSTGCAEIYPSPFVTSDYIVEYSLHPECPIRDTVTVTVKYIDVIDVPNSFSPDDNLVNDRVFVKGPGITDMTFRIFDRYGVKMFETTSQTEGWDGFYKGKKLNPATFMWTLDYTLVDGTSNTKSGTTTLIK